MTLFPEETVRQELFPVTRNTIFFAHAGVAPLPKFVADRMCDYVRASSKTHQEFGEVLPEIKRARQTCARLIGAEADEIALLGPTSLGLSLFANGLPWKEDDEVLCYQGDYPANVYPWIELRRRGVAVRYLEPATPGLITSELVAAALSPRTRLVALASCHFFTGTRVDLEAIGALLHERGVLFAVDAIQTLGAFPVDVARAHIDFLSADAHKWMLGPLSIGIVYVKRAHFDLLRPTLLGAWNVVSPNFIAQDEIVFVPGAQRYEPGALNVAGILGMQAAVDFFLATGIDAIATRLLDLKAHLLQQLDALDCSVLGPRSGDMASSITTFRHPRTSAAKLFSALQKENVLCSLRYDSAGRDYLRFSPHCYNSEGEIDAAIEILRRHG